MDGWMDSIYRWSNIFFWKHCDGYFKVCCCRNLTLLQQQDVHDVCKSILKSMSGLLFKGLLEEHWIPLDLLDLQSFQIDLMGENCRCSAAELQGSSTSTLQRLFVDMAGADLTHIVHTLVHSGKDRAVHSHCHGHPGCYDLLISSWHWTHNVANKNLV